MINKKMKLATSALVLSFVLNASVPAFAIEKEEDQSLLSSNAKLCTALDAQDLGGSPLARQTPALPPVLVDLMEANEKMINETRGLYLRSKAVGFACKALYGVGALSTALADAGLHLAETNPKLFAGVATIGGFGLLITGAPVGLALSPLAIMSIHTPFKEEIRTGATLALKTASDYLWSETSFDKNPPKLTKDDGTEVTPGVMDYVVKPVAHTIWNGMKSAASTMNAYVTSGAKSVWGNIKSWWNKKSETVKSLKDLPLDGAQQ